MNRTILVVDDDLTVLRLVSAFLRRNGFEVIEAEGPSHALVAIENLPGPLDVVLSDVNMPCKDGYELADIIKGKYPDCSVLLMSGEAAQQSARGSRGYPFLPKPFPPNVLVDRITEIIRSNESVAVV